MTPATRRLYGLLVGCSLAGLMAMADAPQPAPVSRPSPPYVGTTGQPVTFNGTSSSGTIIRYCWIFGDGATDCSDAIVSHVYATAGTYTVTLTVTDNRGKSAHATALALISDPVVQPPPPDPTPTPTPTPDPAPTPTPDPAPVPPLPAGGGNAYYDALTQLASFWKGYQLRSQAEIDTYTQSAAAPHYVTYDGSVDAAKVVVPAFAATTGVKLAAPVSPSDTAWTVATWDGSGLLVNRLLRVEHEYALITAIDKTAMQITVARAQQGSTAAAHAAGVQFAYNVNSLPNQVRLPLGTADGHVYVLTWDAMWTGSYLRSGLTNHKCFQVSGSTDSIFFETQTRFDGSYATGFAPASDVASVTARSYNQLGGVADWTQTDGTRLGPSVTKADPLLPKASDFIITPNVWTRFWIVIDQRANDYDYVDYWIADANRAPVQLYAHIPISIGRSLSKFWLEYNTSTDRFVRGDLRDLVSYVRNVVALRDPGDVTPLLVRP